jgi:hypothetical protein
LASGVYRLLFDVLDEYIEVTQPKTVHIGHDEWRIPFGGCPRCKGHDPRELYAQDVNKIYEHLREKNIKVSIYGDHLIEALRGERVQKTSYKGVPTYETPGGLSAEQARTLIPKDILVFNWFWNERIKGGGEVDDIALSDWGFEQVYNNCEPGITNYEQRAAHKGVIGAAPSSWAATNEFTFGKDLMYSFLGCEDLVWTGSQPPQDRLSETIQNLLPGLRRNLSATPFPSDSGPVVPIRIEASLNTASIPGLGLDAMKNGRVAAGNKVFELQSQAGKRVIAVPAGGSESPAIRIGQDVSSILFLHALAKPAHNMTADAGTWNYADTADLPGWYEAVYADGFVQTIPLRYGVNILETGWGKSHAPNNLAYEAELVDCGEANRDRVTFFAYEWVNPRRGIAVKEVRLKTASGFKNVLGKPTPQNTIMLAGVSVVKKEVAPGPKRPEFTD